MGVKPIAMPKYGLQQDEGTVVRWLKQEGDRVEEGEPLLELESDKALFDHASPESGVLRKIVAEEGAVVPVLSIIAIVADSPNEPFDLAEILAASENSVPVGDDLGEGATPASGGSSSETSTGGRVKRSPAARKRARELGVDLASVTGTGPGGRITKEDVERAAQSDPGKAILDSSDEGNADEETLSPIRRAIGKAMTQSKVTIPHFYVTAEIDMTDAEAWRKSVGMDLSVTDLVVKAAAVALLEVPTLNTSLVGPDSVTRHRHAHIGLPVATAEGLLVPVLADADTRKLADLAAVRRRAVDGARQGRLQWSTRATFTVSNLGMYGVTSFQPIINPPEAAALALGAILPRVRPVGDPPEIAVRRVMQVTLSSDHRLVDGAEAGRYLGVLKKSLESVEVIGGWV